MKFKVGIAQISPKLGDLDFNLLKHFEYVEKAKEEKVDLLIFPELSLTGYFLQDLSREIALRLDDPNLEGLKRASREISLVVGLAEKSDGFPYISALYLEGGEVVHVHRKVYLPTHGMFEDGKYFARGSNIRAFDSRFGRAGLLICRDSWHLSSGYILAQDGAKFLILINASPVRGVKGDVPDPDPMLKKLFSVYAYYLNLYLFFAHRVGCEDGLCFYGGSAIFNPLGQVEVSAPYFHEALITATIDPEIWQRKNSLIPLRRDEDLEMVSREIERIKNGRK
ncbi:MAG: carbon-nitrogen hydrolase [Caldiserica bacterium]|jgi:predicted amidohydrolase|nr:carbon-nitrogen hydrolase [Caldisericota bacterium]MDH7562682.1 nitrilase-related carbon-nitrogen hydrolase [Caldisericota bacterium]